MNLTTTGESRVNGYLFVLERSLKTFLPRDVARDAVREIESHLRERDRCRRRRAERARGARADSRGARSAAPRRAGLFGGAHHRRSGHDRPVRPDRARHLAARGHHGHRLLRGARPVHRLRHVDGILRDRRAEADLPGTTSACQFVGGIPVGLGAHFPRSPDVDLRGGYWIIPVGVDLRHWASSSPPSAARGAFWRGGARRRRFIG